ncbi:MAG: prepilin-type N-terminal cleavage/methylation domain-containing protein, partial [Planctomycetota bacterium]
MNRSRGFTLLEILMSTFVIALGSLGLLALFAGAAAQQRASVQLTDSVTFSKNAEALVTSKFRALGSDSVLGCQSPSFVPGYWYP